MAVMTVRNIPDEVHRALRVRAARHGRSAEAEVRSILENAIKPERKILFGDALSSLGRQLGLSNEDVEMMVNQREKFPARAMEFE